MIPNRIALLGLLIAPLANAGDSPTAPEPLAGELKLEFHALRSGNAPKLSGDSLKPDLGKPDYLPIDVALRMHVHADGSTSFMCDEDHRLSDADALPAATAATERTP